MLVPKLVLVPDQTLVLTVVSIHPQRLDRWLTDQVTSLSRSRLQKLIAGGYVLRNGQICTDKNALVQGGDRIDVTIPTAQPLALTAEPMALAILYEDDHLIIVNKPAGLVVHPAPGHQSGTLVHGLLAHCGDQLLGIGGVQRPGIVHRLDQHTSGAMVVAKTDLAHRHLQAQIKAKTAGREYVGVVYGAPAALAGTIDLPLGRHPVDRKKQAIIPLERGGRSAVTHWQVEERLGNFSRLRYHLETGRTHQIRVHSTHIGHPLVGDRTYGPGRDIGVNLPGQALHAERLTLAHPVTGNAIVAVAPWPDHLVTLVQVLRARAGPSSGNLL
ncbi:MAG: RluA family pseudouridine synthase [Cyanobacteriota bacterium]|nr:RluA family pseudouridine synthase [Cyanobacteriota bacterium]